MRQVIDPCLDDDEYLYEIRDRRKLAAKLFLEKNSLKEAAKIEYPLTDSDEEEAAENKRARQREKIRVKEEAKREKEEAKKIAAEAAAANKGKKPGTPVADEDKHSRPASKQTDARPTSVK